MDAVDRRSQHGLCGAPMVPPPSHIMAIGFITLAWVMAGAAIEAAKNNQNAEATEVLLGRPHGHCSLVAEPWPRTV
jgi:hypothetical protein